MYAGYVTLLREHIKIYYVGCHFGPRPQEGYRFRLVLLVGEVVASVWGGDGTGDSWRKSTVLVYKTFVDYQSIHGKTK